MIDNDNISREAALSAQNKSMNLAEMRERLERIPAADVRPVVLCRECKHRFNYPICAYHGDDWFCGYGEKREES